MKEYPGKLISILYRKSQSFFAQMLKEHGLTSAEYPVMILLLKKDGRTQEELSAELVIDKSAITRVVQSLVEKGFVEKQKDAIDKRCNHIYLTEQGLRCKTSIEQTMEEWNDIQTKNIPTEQLDELMRLLHQIVDNVQDQLERHK
ncbi:MAG: MarR family winged helix-turn-helix transcriptional regulator [bacterium]|nr:MarR family winged helix-turn-helix transcriptional regulator [bacterium]